jgi:hypothetical protein
MSKHTLYYSKRCRFCQAFLEELARTPYTREFLLVCVDPAPERPPLPRWLKSVPSMVVVGESEPRVGPGPVNNWLAERKIGGGPVRTAATAMDERRAPLTPPVYNADLAPRPDATARTGGGGGRPGALPAAISSATKADPSMGPPTLAVSGGEDGPLGFHFGGEMGGGKLSDTYSFISAPAFESDKGFNPILKNFESLNAPAMGGAGSGAGGGQRPPAVKVSAKEAKLLSDFEAFTAARDRDVPGPVARR